MILTPETTFEHITDASEFKRLYNALLHLTVADATGKGFGRIQSIDTETMEAVIATEFHDAEGNILMSRMTIKDGKLLYCYSDTSKAPVELDSRLNPKDPSIVIDHNLELNPNGIKPDKA